MFQTINQLTYLEYVLPLFISRTYLEIKRRARHAGARPGRCAPSIIARQKRASVRLAEVKFASPGEADWEAQVCGSNSGFEAIPKKVKKVKSYMLKLVICSYFFWNFYGFVFVVFRKSFFTGENDGHCPGIYLVGVFTLWQQNMSHLGSSAHVWLNKKNETPTSKNRLYDMFPLYLPRNT